MSISAKASSWLLLAALTLSFAAGCGDDDEPSSPAANNSDANNHGIPANNNPDPEEGTWILVDNIHSQKQNPDLRLMRDNYSYQGMHGYHRLFKHLEANSYPYHQISAGTLTDEVLSGYKILFVNLPSEDRPRFTAEEIAAVHRFVEGGGGLFVISDHSNVYYSADILNPLLVPMGITITNATALERDPNYAIGSAWLKIRHFADHPINAGVTLASFQTGGTMETDAGTAFLSEVGFGDDWNEENLPSRVGNFAWDPGEPEGMLNIMAATTFGAGRVVVVGDQNIFGDEWLLVGNNFELVSNIFEWVGGQEAASPPLRERLSTEYLRVGVDLEHADWNIGSNGCAGYFPFFINFNRTPQIAARGIDRPRGDEALLVYPNIQRELSADRVEEVRAHLRRGGWVFVVGDVVGGRSASWRLVEALAPDFAVEGGAGSVSVAALPSNDAAFPAVFGDDAFPVSAPRFDVSGMKMAAHNYTGGAVCPADIEQAQPYLRKTTSSQGVPFLQAEVDGQTVDLARELDVEGGKLVVFLQSGFWRNETLGSERQQPTRRTADAHKIQYKMLDWMVEELR